jgi:hypothetical protein
MLFYVLFFTFFAHLELGLVGDIGMERKLRAKPSYIR